MNDKSCNRTFYDRQYNMIRELLFSDHSVLQLGKCEALSGIQNLNEGGAHNHPFTDCENVNCMHSTWKGVKAPNIMVVQSVDH